MSATPNYKYLLQYVANRTFIHVDLLQITGQVEFLQDEWIFKATRLSLVIFFEARISHSFYQLFK